MQSRLAATTDASNGWSFKIKQTEISIRSGKIKFWIKRAGKAKFAFHFIHKLERAEHFRLCQLAEIHSEIIMRRDGVGQRERFAAGGDSGFGNLSPLGAVVCEIRRVKTGAAKLPGDQRA